MLGTCTYMLAHCSLVQCPCLHAVMFVKFEFRTLAIKCSRFGVPTCVCVDGSQLLFFLCVCVCVCMCVRVLMVVLFWWNVSDGEDVQGTVQACVLWSGVQGNCH